MKLGMEQTTYKFNVNAEAFPHALDLFSQFFKGIIVNITTAIVFSLGPLFSEDAISREINAVDSEGTVNYINY